MRYDRKLKYLEYRERGEKQGSAGFVKLEAREETCRLLIHIKGLHDTDTCRRKVYLAEAGREALLCEMELEKGAGQIELGDLRWGDLGGTGLVYDRIEELRIPLGGGREIYGRIGGERRTEAEPEGEAEEAEEEAKAEPEEEAREEAEEEAKAEPEEEAKGEAEEEAEAEPEEEAREEAEAEPEGEAEEEAETEPERKTVRRSMEPLPTCAAMAEEKWKQLEKVYPHMKPFEDQREFLSVGPGDFVVLPEKYYPMVNNSFLLHGYYNYHHLVLCRRRAEGKFCYYVGVPGNFYEKEKQVAVLFGFEGFECKEEPAKTGDYGYYMMKIEL